MSRDARAFKDSPAKIEYVSTLLDLGAHDDVLLAALGRPVGAKRRKERKARAVARLMWWLGWCSWPVGIYVAGFDFPSQFIIGLSELALIYAAWVAEQVVDPEVG